MTDIQQVSTQARNTRGRTPVYSILLNEEEFDITVHELSVSYSEGMHDVATIRAQSTELEDTEGMADSLISFRFGQSPRIEHFQGYVVDVKEEQGSQGALTFTLSLLGATKVMFEGLPHWWSDKAITSALRDLANKNGLGFTGHTHSHLWKALAQTQESDWAFANSLSKVIGWALFNRYGVVLSYHPGDLFDQSGEFARLVSGEINDPQRDRYLLDFKPAEAADIIEQNLGAKYGYLTTNQTVQIGTQPGDFKGYLFDPTKVIRDQDEAAVYVTSADTTMDTWKQQAIARIWGDADIYPGMCVEIVTTNRRFMRDKYDGKWMVRAVGQQADRQQYQTALYLCRPRSTPVSGLSYQPFWQVGTTRARPTLKAIEGKWVSSWNNQTLASIL